MSAEALKIRSLVEERRQGALPEPTVARALRRAAGLSVYDLATVLGVSAPTISRWETGQRRPSAQLRTSYAQVLKELRRG